MYLSVSSSSSGASSPTLYSSAPPSTVDENETLELAYKLILDDLQNLQLSKKGKAKEGAKKTDEERAFRLLEQEISLTLLSFADQRVARSIDNAIAADADCIRNLVDLEAQAARDRQYALSLSRSSTTDAFPKTGTRTKVTQAAGPSSSRSNTNVKHPQPSTPKTNPNIVNSPSEPCIICLDDIRGKAFIVPCKHYYDLRCLSDLFEAATKDETLYPPRCCGMPIPVESVVGVLSKKLLERFNEKAREFGTQDRLYCSNKTCSVFLGPKAKDSIPVYCSECSANTCAACGSAAHPSEMPCEDDEESRSVIRVGERLGWKRCPGCHRMVELDVGCNHMTCRCNMQFCYVCGVAPWKNCPCPQWDEARLLAAGNERVNIALHEARERPNAARMRTLLAEAVGDLRENHDCRHQNCVRDDRPGVCQNCNHYLDRYLLCCMHCRILICVRCSRNRF